jgi:hypothetical protein
MYSRHRYQACHREWEPIPEVIMAGDKDQKQFFKDEQTVEEVRGFEENYFAVVQRTMMPFPWLADLSKKLQSNAEQHFAACLECSHRLSQSKDFQDFAQIQSEFFQERMWSFAKQASDLSEAFSKSAANMIRVDTWLYPEQRKR